MRRGPVRGLRAIAATLLAVTAAMTYEIATPSPAAADHCGTQINCVHTSPTEDGWSGDVPGQMAEANRGRGGGQPTPCWAIPDPEDDKGGRIVSETYDDPDKAEGVVIWIYDHERNEDRDPEEGMFLTRVCSINGGSVHVRHHLDDTRCGEGNPLNCPDGCLPEEMQEWCQYGMATFLFDALAPEPLIEWWLAGEDFDRRVALPEPDFNPSDLAGIEGPATLVNFDTYLWVPDAGDDVIEEEISVADVTLALEAHRDEFFVWDMGDGHTKPCDSPGIDPMVDGLDHPDACIYSYPSSSARQRDDRFHGNVSVEWVGIYTALVGGVVVDQEEHIVTASEPFEIGVAEAQAIILR